MANGCLPSPNKSRHCGHVATVAVDGVKVGKVILLAWDDDAMYGAPEAQTSASGLLSTPERRKSLTAGLETSNSKWEVGCPCVNPLPLTKLERNNMLRAVELSGQWYALPIPNSGVDCENIDNFVETEGIVIIADSFSDLTALLGPDVNIEVVDAED